MSLVEHCSATRLRTSRRDADEQLYRLLKKGEVCYVLTARQMGKSSLMVQTAARLREEGATVAVLDLTTLGQNLNEEQWYSGLLEIIGEQLRLEREVQETWFQSQSLGPLHRWILALREVVLPNSNGQVFVTRPRQPAFQQPPTVVRSGGGTRRRSLQFQERFLLS